MRIVGTNLIAPVVPFDTTDSHPSHEALYGRGGYRTVPTIGDRDAIPPARREAGMLVYVAADGTIWQLANDLTNWSSFTSAATIAGASDVEIVDVQTGDVLRFSAGRWRNTAERELTDGGNF